MTNGDEFSALREAGVVAVIRADDAESAVRVAGALLAGGIRAIEMTFSTPGAARALHAAQTEYGERILLGAGTIRTPGQVKEAVDAGARFLFTANLNLEVFGAMLATGLPALPGVFTPTEVGAALDAGARGIKLFPASTGGIGHMRAILGPFPGLRIVPTGGVNRENMGDWFAAGAMAVGIGSELAPRNLVREGQWDRITKIARAYAEELRRLQQAPV